MRTERGPIRQPYYAWAIMGAKDIENRSWKSNYRGRRESSQIPATTVEWTALLRDADAVLFRRVVLLLCLVFLAVLLRTAWLGDDALITFRTVMNVTHGHGLTFNIAERVQSYTHPLWLLLLTGAYLVVGNVYYAAFLVSIGVSLAVFWLVLRQAATRMQVWIVVAVLLCSRAFVDYSTSGLENPLSNLLLVTFIALAMRSHEASGSGVTGVWTVASLLYLTRPDNVLLVAPVLVWLTVRATPWTAAARQALTGLLPAAGWTAFSLIYYGVPFPNTAYAKLGTGIARGDLVQQGVVYLLDSIDRDPVTLVTILFAVALGLLSRGPARWIAGGLLVHLAYVVSIGGDFMSGRFLVLPLLAAVLLLSRTIPFMTVPALMTASVLAVIGLTSAEVPLLSDSRFERTSNSMDRRVRGGYGVIDERAFYFQGQSLLLATRQSFLQPDWPLKASQSVLTDVDIACGGLGRIGLSAPLTHLIDRCALTDPLLARLPALYTPDWRIGHLERLIPYGYEESVQQATNLIVNPVVKALYADLHVITRAPQLWSRARWAAIWRVNTGVHRRRIDRWFGPPPFIFHRMPVSGTGWYPEETASGSTRRWTGETATLSFRNPKADATFHLDYTARPALFPGAPQVVTISASNQVLQSFVAGEVGRQRLQIPIPAAAFGPGDNITEIRIRVDRTFVPANVIAGSRDARELGILVHHAAPFPPPP